MEPGFVGPFRGVVRRLLSLFSDQVSKAHPFEGVGQGLFPGLGVGQFRGESFPVCRVQFFDKDVGCPAVMLTDWEGSQS